MTISKRDKPPFSGGIALDEARFLLGDAAAAAAISLPVLRAWLSRTPKVIALGSSDVAPRGKGSATLFTFRRVLAISLTAQLVRLGIAPAKAGAWAHLVMDAEVGWKGNKKAPVHFLHPATVIAVYPDGEGMNFTNDPEAKVLDLMRGGDAPSAALVSYHALLRGTIARLKERGALTAEETRAFDEMEAAR